MKILSAYAVRATAGRRESEGGEMGKRGPKPKPTALRVFEGTRIHRPTDRTGEPTPLVSDSVPESPDWLGEHGKAEWSRMVPILHSIGCFTESDWLAFSHLCGASDRFHAARQDVAETGMFHETENGRAINPAMKVMKEASDQIVKIGNMFGMSPSSRVGLSGVPRDDARDDLERFKSEVG